MYFSIVISDIIKAVIHWPFSYPYLSIKPWHLFYPGAPSGPCVSTLPYMASNQVDLRLAAPPRLNHLLHF